MDSVTEETSAPVDPTMVDTGDGYDDYFGVSDTGRTTLPDGKQWIEWKVLNEGERRKYLNRQNRELALKKGGDAVMKMAPGDDRFHLLSTAIVGWNLHRRDKTGQFVPVPFSKNTLEEWLNVAPPKIVDLVEKDVRKANPWLLNDLSIEEIDKEIAALEEMREVKRKEMEGKES